VAAAAGDVALAHEVVVRLDHSFRLAPAGSGAGCAGRRCPARLTLLRLRYEF
jgi:hypothetical protein